MKDIKKYLYSFLILAFIITIYSCEEDDYPISIEKDSSLLSDVESFEIRPGNGKVLIQGIINDPQVSEVIISWEDGANSISVPVSTSTEVDTIQETIDNLQEKLYIFKIQSSDESGNTSKTISAGVNVYGSNFISNSKNRELISSSLLRSQLELEYAPVANFTGIINTKIIYENSAGENVELLLDNNTNSAIIEDFRSGSSFQYRSAYVASPGALDTIYTEYENFKPEPIPIIAFVTDDANDDEQITWLQEQGFYVFTYYNATLSTASEEDINTLNDANLVIIGRSGASADFGGDQKASWNALTAPLILNSQWIARSNRINWFNNIGNPVEYNPETAETVNSYILKPQDSTFDDINLSEDNILPWMSTPNNILYTNASNGNILAVTAPSNAGSEEGGAVLFVRFETGVEFYEGAGESAAGPRTFFGFGSDFDGSSYYFPLTEEARAVYLKEINRYISLSFDNQQE